jgi:Thioredoxin
MTATLPNTLGVDLDLWHAGLTIDAFVDAIDSNQEALRNRLRDIRLSAEDRAAFAQITSTVYALVLTEGWCGDSLMNLPILTHIADAAPSLELRVFVRSQEPELTAAYQARGIKNIPVFTFFDEDFNEIGTWVERSQAAHQRVAAWRLEHPELERIYGAADLSAEQKQAQLQPILHGLRVEMDAWYAEDLQDATVAELKALLSRVR